MTAATVDPARVSAERKPSTRQVYAIAHRACELLGVDWPADRRAASELIGQLQGAQSPEAADDIPF
jgi:hypothetical protein